MADNYLERREQELKEKRPVVRRSCPSLDSLLKRNRSYRGYDQRHTVTEDELKKIVAASVFAASGMNKQTLRYKLVTAGDADKVLPYIKLGAALPAEHLPHPGEEPQAFIVVCCKGQETKITDIDLGIAAQSMLLKATEMGLGGIFILNFRAEEVRNALGMEAVPIAIIAIGKPAETIYLVPVHEGDELNYYRKDGIHFVPKLQVEDLLI